MKLNRALIIAVSLLLAGPAFADNGMPGSGGNGMPVIGTNQPSTYLPSSAYPTIVPAYPGTFTLTSGSNTFTVDATTASEISAGMSVISAAGFNQGTTVASIVGTTVTTTNSKASPNALVSGATAVQFGLNRFTAPYIGATNIMAKEGWFGEAAQGNTTWAYSYMNSADYPGQSALVALNNKYPAATFGVHTSGFTSANNASAYPVFLNAVNDNPTYANTVWGAYIQMETAPGSMQGRLTGIEISPLNYGVATCGVDPFTLICGALNQSVDLLLDSGNGYSGLNNITAYIQMWANGAKARSGIVFDQSSLDTISDPHAPAIAMPGYAALTWYVASGIKGWSIYDGTTINQQNTLVFNQNAAVFSAGVQSPVGTAAAAGLQLGTGGTGFYNPGAAIGFAVGGASVGYINAVDAAFTSTGFATKVSVQGCSSGTVTVSSWANYSIVISAMPASGNCTVNLPASPISGQQIRVTDGVGTANTHNIVVTPASGNIDGSATYTITTSYGAWSGEYETTFFKTVSKL